MDDAWQGGPPPDDRDEPVERLANIEAEAALLGGLMIDNKSVGAISEIIRAKDFFVPVHGRIFHAIIRLSASGRSATPVTLKPIFDADPDLSNLGGAAYLAQLTGSSAALIGLRDFADQVRDMARMRNLRDAFNKSIDKFLGEELNIADATAPLETAIWEAVDSQKPIEQYDAAGMIGLAEARVEQVEEQQHAIGARCALVPDLDVLLGPLEGGGYTILAGRPGMGKTTTAISASIGYAMNGHPVYYPHAEMSPQVMALKVAADLAHAMGHKVPFKNIRQGMLAAADRASLARSKEVAQHLPLRFAGIGRCDIKRLDALVARECAYWEARGRKLEVVVPDYLQLLSAEGRHRPGDERGRVTAVSDGLLTIAQRYGVHVLALSQLTRAVDGRPDKRPHLADLRESGRIEEDADAVIFVFRHEYYLEKEKPTAERELADWEIDMSKARGRVEFIVGKNRLGEVASRKGHFYGDYSAVRGSTHREDEPEFADRWTAFLRGEGIDV